MKHVAVLLICTQLVAGAGHVMAADAPPLKAKSEALEMDEIKVMSLEEDLRRLGVLKDVIQKTQEITPEEIQDRQAGTLFEAIKDQPGVVINTECSMCGIKRVMINGLKGEHTTILVDGVPMHSVVSSYYGSDALATSGVSRIEIARGAGASLLAPEAIGGTINILYDKPTRNSTSIDLSAGSKGYRKASIVNTLLTKDQKMALLTIGQFDDIGQMDADKNGVNEAPRLQNYSLTLKGFYDISENNQLQLRATMIRSDIHGGYMSDNYEGVRQDPGTPAFVDGDVRKRYIGNKLATSEYVLTERQELAGTWLHKVNNDFNFALTASYAKHSQDSIYEGFDYRNSLPTYFGNLKANYKLHNHLLTAGMSGRTETLRSSSYAMSANPLLKPDSYDYSEYGVYVQDAWNITPNLEVTGALRLDKVVVDYTANKETGNEIDELIIVPRFHARWKHTPHVTSQASFGRGYRAPLSFFESEHGILEEGFNVKATKLEKSWGGGYNINYSDALWAATCGFNYTWVENLAKIDTENYSVPTLINSGKPGEVWAVDIAGSIRATEWLTLGVSYDQFIMSKDYKSTFTVAPIEKRVGINADISHAGWKFNTFAYWIPSRNLADYGYNGYNVYNGGTASDKKTTTAPSFWQVDVKLSKQLNKYMTVYTGVKNLFNYTQAGNSGSPLYYSASGNYDVAYIYGPLRERTVYAGAKFEF